MQFKLSQTYQHLLSAYQTKCCQSFLYQQYAQKAQQEGLTQIMKYFLESSKHETSHASVLLRCLEGESDTLDHLKFSIKDEKTYQAILNEYAQTAKSEGYDQIARYFDNIRDIDQAHEAKFQKLLYNIENEEIYEKPFKASWICSCCGYAIYHRDAPLICPVCHSSIECFELENNNY